MHWWLGDPEIERLARTGGWRAAWGYAREHGAPGLTELTARSRFSREGWLGPPGGYRPRKRERTPDAAELPVSDKARGEFNWREATTLLRGLQDLKARASSSQDRGRIEFLRGRAAPVCIVGLSDLHMGSWATDYETLTRVTDELLAIPDLYAILLGDEEQMAIKMRSVLEVSDNILPPKLQHAFFASWLEEVQHKVLAACWSNHAEMREEAATGYSASAAIKARSGIYHNGIGHLDVVVGTETYRLALSHFFRGRSMYNPVHGQMRYGRSEAHDRDVIFAGDSHVPGVLSYWEAGRQRIALNGGTAQVNSGYGKRFFSLTTADVWPCVVLFPTERRMVPFWSIADWLAVRGSAAA